MPRAHPFQTNYSISRIYLVKWLYWDTGYSYHLWIEHKTLYKFGFKLICQRLQCIHLSTLSFHLVLTPDRLPVSTFKWSEIMFKHAASLKSRLPYNILPTWYVLDESKHENDGWTWPDPTWRPGFADDAPRSPLVWDPTRNQASYGFPPTHQYAPNVSAEHYLDTKYYITMPSSPTFFFLLIR